MKIRRFVGKRRRKAARRFADLMAARHVQAEDRHQLRTFGNYLAGRMSVDQERAYEAGES